MNPQIAQLKINGRTIDMPKQVVNEVNNFFVNVGPNTEKEVPKVPNIAPEKFLKNRNQFNFIIAHIFNEEVLEIINSLTNKSTGPSSIPLNLLQSVADLIVFPLCYIINKSLLNGIFPDKLKIVKVVPLHKGGSTEDLNNFRPISLLSIFDKIIEKIMHKRLYHFLELHNVLFDNQFGFRKNNSTSYALMEITEKIKESIDNGKYGCGIYIDLRKAFDTVNHNILIKKLEHYGVRGILLEWFKSYLNERKQFVFMNGESSDIKYMACGVPQGSVLGPLLFLLYINDLPNISAKLKFFLFADDTNIYFESDDLLNVEKTVNKELKKLYLWLNVNRLSLNVSKTQYIIFHPYNKPLRKHITIKINKKAITEKDHIKYLGVIIDSHLNWKKQILSITKKMSRCIGIMCKLRHFVTREMLKNIYYSLLYPHLVYAIEVWGSACAAEINKILVLQKRALRIIIYNDMLPSVPGPLQPPTPLFHKMDILKIYDVFQLQLAKFIFNCIHLNVPSIFHNWFKLNYTVHNYNTRSTFSDIDNALNSNNIFIINARTTHYGLKLIKVSGPKFWNCIPKKKRDSQSANSFKLLLKKHLITQYVSCM